MTGEKTTATIDSTKGMVTMTLQEYTDLIIQIHDLKNIVAGYKLRITKAVKEEIREDQINSIETATECELKLSLSDDTLLKEFSSDYSWRWESISQDNFGILSPDQVKNCAVTTIKRILSSRLKDLREKEEKASAK